MEGKWFDLCSLEKSEKSVVDQISQCSSVVVKNPKNSCDIFINAYSYCNSHVERAKRVKDGQAKWRKHKVKVDGQTKIDNQRQLLSSIIGEVGTKLKSRPVIKPKRQSTLFDVVKKVTPAQKNLVCIF